jgi:hypothetical protein
MKKKELGPREKFSELISGLLIKPDAESGKYFKFSKIMILNKKQFDGFFYIRTLNNLIVMFFKEKNKNNLLSIFYDTKIKEAIDIDYLVNDVEALVEKDVNYAG